MDDRATVSGNAAAEPDPEPPRVLSRPIYCRRCDYDLRAVSAGRCPECGAPFDRLRPHTYSQRTRAQDRWRLAGWGGLFAGVAAAVIGSLISFGFAETLVLLMPICGMAVLLAALVSVVTSGRMIERTGRRRTLRTFNWPRRRW